MVRDNTELVTDRKSPPQSRERARNTDNSQNNTQEGGLSPFLYATSSLTITAFSDEQIVVSLIRQLSWLHFIFLIPLKDPRQLDYDAQMAGGEC